MRINSYSEYKKAIKAIERQIRSGDNSTDDVDEMMEAVINYESNSFFDSSDDMDDQYDY